MNLTMSAEEYREAMASLSLSQGRLGRLLNLDEDTPVRWATGAEPVPQAVALLLLVLWATKFSVEELEHITKPGPLKVRRRGVTS